MLCNISKINLSKAGLSFYLKWDCCNPITSVSPQLLISILFRSCSANFARNLWYQFSQGYVLIVFCLCEVRCFYKHLRFSFMSPAQISFLCCCSLFLFVFCHLFYYLRFFANQQLSYFKIMHWGPFSFFKLLVVLEPTLMKHGSDCSRKDNSSMSVT